MDNDQGNGDQQIQQIEQGTDIVPKICAVVLAAVSCFFMCRFPFCFLYI